jgi:hypothetical protein
MAVPEIAIMRAVVSYIFREESAKQAEEIASAHATMLARELGADRGER